MQVHNLQLNSPIKIEKINLAIGNFDGIHLGHQKIIEQLIHQSNELKIDSAIMSFIPHPRKYFSRNHTNFNIISDSLKIKLLKESN